MPSIIAFAPYSLAIVRLTKVHAVITKLQRVRNLLKSGKEFEALRLVNSLGRLGPDAEVIRRGYAAVTNPAFYESLDFTPNEEFAKAIAAVRRRYNIPEPKANAVTDYDALADAGFQQAGTNEFGMPFYVLTMPDGRVVVTGDEAKGAGIWGADLYPSAAALVAGENRRPFPGVYTDPRALVGALQWAGLLPN